MADGCNDLHVSLRVKKKVFKFHRKRSYLQKVWPQSKKRRARHSAKAAHKREHPYIYPSIHTITATISKLSPALCKAPYPSNPTFSCRLIHLLIIVPTSPESPFS